jgi:hypothetical protein
MQSLSELFLDYGNSSLQSELRLALCYNETLRLPVLAVANPDNGSIFLECLQVDASNRDKFLSFRRLGHIEWGQKERIESITFITPSRLLVAHAHELNIIEPHSLLQAPQTNL